MVAIDVDDDHIWRKVLSSFWPCTSNITLDENASKARAVKHSGRFER
jgi:hypothetical protein